MFPWQIKHFPDRKKDFPLTMSFNPELVLICCGGLILTVFAAGVWRCWIDCVGDVRAGQKPLKPPGLRAKPPRRVETGLGQEVMSFADS